MSKHLRNRSFTDDPLAILTRPPPNETPAERQRRVDEEKLAQHRSDLIDEQIKQDRAVMLQAQAVERKLLLLGQAESGKTTTLKQFQLLQSQSAFSAQLNSYRALIYLNILHSVRHILDAVALPDNDPLSDASSSSSQDSVLHQNYPPHITALVSGLRPLLHIQTVLERQLQDSDEAQVPRRSRRAGSSASSGDDSVRAEVTVHAWSSWSERFTSKSKASSPTDSISMDWSSQDDPGRVFESCRDVLIALWEDETVQSALDKQRPSIRESPGFFMDDLPRIAARGYMPSQDDILRARIRTLGVQEHCVRFERGPDSGLAWRIFDVGGARSQRLRWAAYFQDVNAIIFLAPISPFNQTLAEDPRMNRVKDSLLLWQDICRNKVLEKVSIVLFLNKCDLLKAKLQAGVQFRKYMTAYEGPNEWEPVAEFLKAKFDEVYRANYKPGKRTLYVHRTSVVDSRAMQKIITSVREQIMKEALAAVGLF